MGLYLVVWGKSKEQKCVMPPSPEKGQQQLPVTVPKIEGNDDNNNKTQLVIIGDKTTSDVEVGGSSTQSRWPLSN